MVFVEYKLDEGKRSISTQSCWKGASTVFEWFCICVRVRANWTFIFWTIHFPSAKCYQISLSLMRASSESSRRRVGSKIGINVLVPSYQTYCSGGISCYAIIMCNHLMPIHFSHLIRLLLRWNPLHASKRLKFCDIFGVYGETGLMPHTHPIQSKKRWKFAFSLVAFRLS